MVDDSTTPLEQFEARFSIDGPHTSEDLAAAAGILAAAVRYLNHATLPHRASESIPFPGTGSKIVSTLAGAVAGLGQLTEQLGQRFTAFADDENVYDDGMGTKLEGAAPARARLAARHLTDASNRAYLVVEDLDEAFSQTNRLGYR